MNKRNLKSIGEIAKIVHLSVSTLRYYDEIGLIKPSYTDKTTNYRYYSDDQVSQLLRILEYKKYGFNLDAIRGLLYEPDNNKIISALKSKAIELNYDAKEIDNAKKLLLNRINNHHERENNSTRKILLVDDSTFLRGVLREFLSNNDFLVIGEATNGLEGIAQYQELKPDIVIMDIGMPQLDGLSATKEIVENYPDAKIIMCSAKSQLHNVINSIKYGALDFIPKPFHQEHMIISINKLSKDNDMLLDNLFTEAISIDKDLKAYLEIDVKLSLSDIQSILDILKSNTSNKKVKLLTLLKAIHN